MIRRCLTLLLFAAAGAGPAAAVEAAPDWSIDRMVANGAATAEERDAFVKTFVASCIGENEKVGKRIGKDDLASYCACTAGKSTAVITSGDIGYMVANNNALPATAMEKLRALARDCGGYLIERQAGQ
jgi:hypothetical protein